MTTLRLIDCTLPTAPLGRATGIDGFVRSRVAASAMQRFVVATQSLA